MKKWVQEHKKIVGVIGFTFIIALECCIFPVCNLTHSVHIAISFVNLYAAIVLCKCIGDIEVFLFPKWKWWMILLCNIVVAILGMVARYFLEYGEISNTYNFTAINVLVHLLIMVLLSFLFWLGKQRKENEA